MKILHCLAQLPSNTGSGVYYHTLVQGMEKRGHQNALIYGIQEPFTADFSEDILRYPVRFQTEELPFCIAGMSDEMPYPSTIYAQMTEEMYAAWTEAFRKRLQRAKDELCPDIIISHHIFILTSLVREIFPDTPLVGVSHGTDIRQVKKNPWIQERYIKNVDKLQAYLALSPKDRKELGEVFGIPTEKVSILGGGFKEEYFYEEKRHPDDKVRIFYAGKIAQAKGVFELCSALALLNTRYENLKLLMVGNADEEAKKLLRQNANGASNLYIMGAQNQKEMAVLMLKCDIFVLPSYYEGLGLIAIEGLACGLRAVTTRIEGLMELLGEELNASGVIEYVDLPRLYEVDKPFAEDKPVFVRNLADKLALQIERVQKKERIPEKIRAAIRSHSWEGIVDRIEEILQSNIGK